MEIKSRPLGAYRTNCYIVTIDSKQIIIDPGEDATPWVMEQIRHPVAILNTHGHFDHVWCNKALQERLGVKLYTPKEDLFFVDGSLDIPGLTPSKPDYLVGRDEQLNIDGISVRFWHYPGHTPGCSVIEIGGVWFSGDFIFKGSIGRYDFPFSDPKDMYTSLQRFGRVQGDKKIYPGHGAPTSIKEEQRTLSFWLEQLKEQLADV